MLLLFGAFIAGLLTVLAPCVLPLLPIIIGGSASGNALDKKRPVVIAAALAVSIIAFTLLLKVTTLLINLPTYYITYVSGGIIVLLGLAILFPSLYSRAIGAIGIEAGAQKALGKGYNNKNTLLGPIIIGAALGPVFSSCSPVYAYILASVLPVNFGQAFIYMISYVLGLSTVLLAIGYYGQRFVARIKFASNPRGLFQRTLAVIFVIVGLLVITGYDKRFQTYVASHTPFNFDALSSQLLPASKHETNIAGLFNVQPYAAPEFKNIDSWINSSPLTLKGLRGKVVLVDFWTYSCINCIRNNPYIEKWYEAYKADGFVAIGVHAPEFAFERVPANVERATVDQHVTYPVGLDNNFDTWNAFNNRSWPASYLIDATGQIRRIHEGEGEYAQEEQAIRQLLIEKGAQLSGGTVAATDAVPITAAQTPETYLGYERASNFVGTPALAAASQSVFTPLANLDTNYWTLGGTWEVQGQKIIARGNSVLRFKVAAKEVYLVGGSSSAQPVGLTLDGKPISVTDSAGSDVSSSTITFGESRLYRLVKFPQFTSGKVLELTVPNGVELNAFTFGS